jgi:DNA-directed RNA polymerase subunit L
MLKVSSYDNTWGSSRMELNMKKVDYVIVNSIRRTILSDIPIYAFETTVNVNTSVFNNNYIKLRMSNLPVFGIENNLVFFKKTEEKDEEESNFDEGFGLMDDIELTVDKNVDSSSINNFTLYLNYENKTPDIVTVTTKDCDYFYKGKKISNPYKVDIPIIKLQPDQKINLTSVSKLGIEKESAIYSPVSICSYQQVSDDEFNFFLESRGQITEHQILERAIDNLLKNVDDLIRDMSKMKTEDGMIKVGDIDHTLGNLISHFAMMEKKEVEMFTYKQPHPLDPVIVYHYRLKSSTLDKVLEKVNDNISKTFKNLKQQLVKK